MKISESQVNEFRLSRQEEWVADTGSVVPFIRAIIDSKHGTALRRDLADYIMENDEWREMFLSHNHDAIEEQVTQDCYEWVEGNDDGALTVAERNR